MADVDEVDQVILALEQKGLIEKARDENGNVLMRGGQIVWRATAAGRAAGRLLGDAALNIH